MTSPLISIVTVCYNAEKTIERTLQSIQEQKYPNIQYIIIDGGSTDRTLEIIDRYRDLVDIYLSEPDDGIYDAMNKGIRLCTGDVIGLLNSDDWYEPDTLEIIAKEYLKSDGKTIFHGLCKMIEDGKEGTILSYHHDVLPYECIVHTSCFLPKKLYENYGLFDASYKISGDYELLLRMYVSGVQFNRLEKILVNFRLGGVSNSLSSKYEDIRIQYHHKQFSRKKFYLKMIKQAVVHAFNVFIIRYYQKYFLRRTFK